MKRIILNRIQTPDGTRLTSEFTNDYKCHNDANGERYIVDGGNDYLRRSANKEPFIELSLYDDEPHKVIRQHIKWGTFGKHGDKPLTYKPLCELDDEHINAILETQRHIEEYLRKYLEAEKEYRSKLHKS